MDCSLLRTLVRRYVSGALGWGRGRGRGSGPERPADGSPPRSSCVRPGPPGRQLQPGRSRGRGTSILGGCAQLRGTGPRGDRDRLGLVHGAAGKRRASTGESEVKFAISESSQPGPSAQFPAPLDAAARLVTECLTRGDQGGGSPQSGRSKVGVCTEKRESAPGRLVFPKQDTRSHCPAAGAGWSQV